MVVTQLLVAHRHQGPAAVAAAAATILVATMEKPVAPDLPARYGSRTLRALHR